MNKAKISAFLMSILFLASITVIAIPVSAKRGVIKVPRDYATIQEAINAAQDGDLILVGPGEYAGAVVNKTVEIRGEEGETVINDGPYVFPPHTGGPKGGFLFITWVDSEPGVGTGNGSSISGFTFECDIFTGSLEGMFFPIMAVKTDNVVVKNNVIRNALFGIINWDGSNWAIKDNDILESQLFPFGAVGIIIGSVWGGPANGNLVKGNRIIGAPQADGLTTVAIGLASTKDEMDPEPTGGPVENNRIVDNYIAWGGPSGIGIALLDGWGDDVVNNKVASNEVHDSTWGIAVLGASSNAFTENSIEDSQESGIYVTYSYDAVGNILSEASGNRFSDNKVKGSGVNGIFMDVGSVANYIVKNKVSESGEFDLKDLGTDNVWKENKFETSYP